SSSVKEPPQNSVPAHESKAHGGSCEQSERGMEREAAKGVTPAYAALPATRKRHINPEEVGRLSTTHGTTSPSLFDMRNIWQRKPAATFNPPAAREQQIKLPWSGGGGIRSSATCAHACVLTTLG
ncbi:unnamed protein product, partial [Ectocarpus sp. 12 AP-2014]